jgi:ring-1,2-phenylacetyl-CoA epoxidase subunit PaaD
VSVLELAREVAGAVPDPELPGLTLADLGILREVEIEGETLVVTVTPTYSGCPAMREIMHDVRRRLEAVGMAGAQVRVALQPAWTSDWITAAGRSKLAAAGIAPPAAVAAPPSGPVPLALGLTRAAVPCPQCGGTHTVEQSHFGATACRALYRCRDCGEPFEYVKDI